MIKTKKINLSTKYKYAFYKITSTVQLPEDFGGMILPKYETVFMPTTLNTDSRTLCDTLENQMKPLSNNTVLKNENLLIIRYGGIGDIIASLFGIAELKVKYPSIKIGFVCSIKYASILNCFPGLVDEVFNSVIPSSKLKKYKYFAHLDNAIENHPESNSIPIQELFSKLLYVDLNPNILDFIHATNITLNDRVRDGIGIQYKTNALNRDYNLDNMIKLIQEIRIAYPNKKIHLLGKENDTSNVNYIQSKTNGQVIPNGCGGPILKLPQTVELISTLELVIAPDSSMLHIAGVCNTPMIGLFGAFPGELRISYYNNSLVMQPQCNCPPCFRHFPINFCKHNFGEGMCVNSIDPKDILTLIRIILTSI